MGTPEVSRRETERDIDRLDVAPDEGWSAQYVDGEWRPADGDTLDVINPATQSPIGAVPAGTAGDVDAAYEAATDAQSDWAERTPRERIEPVARVQRLLEEYAEELTYLFAVECGGPTVKAEVETDLAASQLQAAQGLALDVGGTHKDSVTPGKENIVHREPVGVVGAITPWNFPFHLSMRIVAPAVALGNAVVLKPATDTPIMGGLMLARLFDEAGLPDGVLNVVPGEGSEAGDAVAGHADIDLLSFTGSSAVGREVGKRAVENFAQPALELGGNNAHVVLSDADLDRAVDGGVFGSFTHQGQECISINRHVVHESLYDEYVDRLAERAEQLPVGDPRDEDTVVGPVINEDQRDTMLEYVEESVDAGATLETGGDHDGLFVEPTVLSDATNEMAASCNEHFGPIAPVVPVSDDDEAVAVANDTEYGLSGSVHSTDLERAKSVAERMETGMVHVNDQPLNDEAHIPFGGMKASGIGRYNGEWIGRELTETKWISVQRDAREYPY